MIPAGSQLSSSRSTLLALGEREYLEKEEDVAMPANNRLLVFRKKS